MAVVERQQNTKVSKNLQKVFGQISSDVVPLDEVLAFTFSWQMGSKGCYEISH